MNAAGVVGSVLERWPGVSGTPVRTTIDSSVQGAALAALKAPEFGRDRRGPGVDGPGLRGGPAPGLRPAAGRGCAHAKLAPGTAFTIVSAAALLGTKVTTMRPRSLREFVHLRRADVHQRRDRSAAAVQGRLRAGLRYGLRRAVRAALVRQAGSGHEGIRDRLRLVLAAGARLFRVAATLRDDADLAADMIGQGNVRMSLLSMALVAAVVDHGSWLAPEVSPTPAIRPGRRARAEPDAPCPRCATSCGVRSAREPPTPPACPAAPVYGQVGLVHTGSGWMSWFVGFRGNIAFTVMESGNTPQLSAAALAGPSCQRSAERPPVERAVRYSVL